MTEFELQFDISEVRSIAARYSYEDDEPVLAIGRTARERGWYTKPELVQVCRWKSPRTQPRVAENDPRVNSAATRGALSSVSEKDRMKSLCQLRGVSWATASVLLHLSHHDPYPILDYRALEALGIARRNSYSMQFWLDYVAKTRELAEAARVDMRTLDRSLWQWSKERTSVAGPSKAEESSASRQEA